ncbi:Methylmalonate-semialdehyde dehydrogenase [acylating], mitochondrial [Tetrabaena socialis]|uniref:Methylmalonate-semialdehyde dehydrogenase [acylating], mitochondrial n=1 Tax=Tetrabaena socialis TaxID=47790 RepID=A0A2J8AK13_9CHLO|nr:Methylmalonate-semialdehyde dehydrogenase [acylating], mitochondrial [Tetrabaena socialis]|eukprot:PNH12848.1 Methylmalonate-semialdehyde dehydrogenase [acylating], mitochondrial [Tetrabaena socialis]
MVRMWALIAAPAMALARGLPWHAALGHYMGTGGKTLADARGDVFRGLEVVEAACGIAPYMAGEMVENVASGGIDCYSLRQPLGVVAGICPFNFPAMVPLWMFPLAVTAGNTFLLKPSERDPGAAVMLADLAQQAGLPK